MPPPAVCSREGFAAVHPVLIDFIHETICQGTGLPAIEVLVVGAPSIVNAEQASLNGRRS